MVLLILRAVTDECLPVYIALRTPYKDKAHLESYIARLAVSLEILAYGFQPRPSAGQDGSRDSSPGRNEDLLWSGDIDLSEGPMTIIEKESKQGLGRHVLVIWRTIVPLCGTPNRCGYFHGLLIVF